MKSEFKNLPSGWKVVRLGEIGKILNGLTYSPENVSNNGLLVLRSSNINDNFIVLNNDDVYVKGISKFNKTLENDILICVRNGSKNLIGKNALITEKYKDLAFGAFMAIFRSNYNLFLIHIFKTNTFFKQVKNDLGATINSINNSNLLNFKIPLPPIDEQEKIAEILSTWDEAINLTINLIENKKRFKKALMQNLLTAKIRFPEFKDEWEETILGKICDISTGTSKSRFIGNGKFYIVDMGSITQDGLLNSTKTTNLSKDFLDCGDLVMPKDDIGGGKIIGKVAVINKDNTYVLSDHIFRIKTTENSNFLAYLINYDLNNKKIRREVSGTAQFGLGRRTIENLKIFVPSLNEQQKIAEVLTACDDEINLLNLKLENLKKQKQGLMQKLLKGEMRTCYVKKAM